MYVVWIFVALSILNSQCFIPIFNDVHGKAAGIKPIGMWLTIILCVLWKSLHNILWFVSALYGESFLPLLLLLGGKLCGDQFGAGMGRTDLTPRSIWGGGGEMKNKMVERMKKNDTFLVSLSLWVSLSLSFSLSLSLPLPLPPFTAFKCTNHSIKNS